MCANYRPPQLDTVEHSNILSLKKKKAAILHRDFQYLGVDPSDADPPGTILIGVGVGPIRVPTQAESGYHEPRPCQVNEKNWCNFVTI